MQLHGLGHLIRLFCPFTQFINWVKYSKYTPGSGPNGTDFTQDWQYNFDSFDESRWAKGDWTFDGNLVDFSPNNIQETGETFLVSPNGRLAPKKTESFSRLNSAVWIAKENNSAMGKVKKIK